MLTFLILSILHKYIKETTSVQLPYLLFFPEEREILIFHSLTICQSYAIN